MWENIIVSKAKKLTSANFATYLKFAYKTYCHPIGLLPAKLLP